MVGSARILSLLCFGIAMLVSATAVRGADTHRWAKLSDTVFTHVVRDSELPATSGANTITEDGDGFIWVGMQVGLARWDGHHFRVFQPNGEDPSALPDSYINVLHTDLQGRLWIGTNSAGLARYDSDGDRFITYATGANGLSDLTVNAIVDDGAGGLWVGTRSGLDHLDPASGQVQQLRHDPNDPTSLPANRVVALRRDRADTLWVGTVAGLARRDRETNGFVSVPLPVRPGQPPYVLSLFEDSEGRMWVGTRGQGVYVVDRASGAVTAVAADPRMSLGQENIRAFSEVRPGVIWIGTDSHGIVEVDASTATQVRNIVHDSTLPTSLGEGAIYVVYRDRSGLAWVGTDRSLSRHDAQTAVSTVFGATSRTDSLTDPDVNAVLEMPDGHVWLGSGKGIDVVDPDGVRVASLLPDPEQPERALPRAYVTALIPIGGDVYVATRKGVYRADRAARGVVRLSVPHRPDADDIATLLLDDGVLWVAGKLGVHALDISGGNDERIEFARTAQLNDQRVNALGRGPGGSLWVGTENGLDRIDFAKRTVEHVLSEGSLGLITSILTDRSGRLWVGSFGAGISVMQVNDRGTTLIQRIGVANGLRNTNVNQLLEDASGRIWASTDDGLAAVDPVTFKAKMLDNADGVTIRTYWGGSGSTTAAGELLFGGLGGLTVVRPDQVTAWSYRPPIVVTGARVGGKHVTANRFNSLAAADPLIVMPEANSLAVEFAALDYSAPERTRYAYRLEGYDKDWVEADTNQRVAAYTNLSPGTYALKLRGSNRNGEWTENPLSVPVRVLPAWFQTVSFRIVLVLAGLALLVGLIHVRTAYLHHRQRALEQQVAERTASLKQRTEELQESQRQLEQIAYFDVLTRLPNRRRFRDELSALIARSKKANSSFALALIDLDRFKQINDTLGHEAGDLLLQQAAKRFKACVGEGDMVARLGGDEFVLLLPHENAAERATAVARGILAAAAEPFVLVGQEFRVSGSIGICTYPADGQDEQTLMKRADIAMYQAKAEGKNTFQFYSEETNSSSVERLRMESDLRHALEYGEFQLHYQARRDIQSGQMSGVEALLCWQHPELGMIPAAKFMPVAEETGLSVPIGKWALRTACLQNVAWRRQGLPCLSIAVSLTARQFCDERLVEDIAATLEEAGMAARLLELEIAESLMIRDVERSVRILTALKSIGIRIAIDNFGAGYSSLTTLQRFPLDMIKIDRAFISDITSFDSTSTLTDAVIAMGRSLSLTVVAQGVETRDQAEFLRQHACDELQGFYFNKPLPAEQFGQLLFAQAAGATYVGERAALLRAT